MRKENDYCVILAGGQGRRLWPYSRKKKPKQFIDFFGNGQSLLQQTYKRFAQFIPEDHIYVSTFADYADITYEQLPNLPKDNVLLEPVQLSTAPAVGMAHCTIALRDPNANIIISPCDQFIMDEERFTSQLIQGLAFVERNPDFLALGVNPTYPNTGYGYIQMSNETKGQGYARIKSFTEKPEAEFARMFVQSGEFLWNTGLFLWNVQTMDAELPALLPAVSLFRSSSNHGAGLAEELEVIKSTYASNHYLAIDLFILERCHNVYVQKCDFGWADMGCWSVLHEVEHKDVDGNSVTPENQVLMSGCRDNLIRLPHDMKAVLQGLDGYMITLKDNLLVICKNDDPNRLRRMNNETQMKLGDDWV